MKGATGTACLDQLFGCPPLFAACARVADGALSAAYDDLDRMASLEDLDLLTDGRLHKLIDLHELDGYEVDDAWLITGGVEEAHVNLVRDFLKILAEPSPLKRFTRAGMLARHGKGQPLERNPVYADWATPVYDLIADLPG